MCATVESFHMRCRRRILHIRWHDYITNNEVLHRTGLLAASSIVHKRRLRLFGHVARLADDVPANRILQTCCEAQDGVRPCSDWRHAWGRPITWTHQICRDTGVTVTDALRLAEDRSFWRQIATARSYGWTLRVQEVNVCQTMPTTMSAIQCMLNCLFHIILSVLKQINFLTLSRFGDAHGLTRRDENSEFSQVIKEANWSQKVTTETL